MNKVNYLVNKVNYLQIQIVPKVKMYATVSVPAYEFKFNLVVCPLPEGITDVSLFKSICKY